MSRSSSYAIILSFFLNDNLHLLRVEKKSIKGYYIPYKPEYNITQIEHFLKISG
jgi:hypothetical protein